MNTNRSRRAVVLRATDEPMAGLAAPAPNQRYRHPRLELEERPLGALDPLHVRVEMLYAGICGTDLHLVQQDPGAGYVRTSAPALIPASGRIIGHEGVGRIVEAGSAVRDVRAGDIVAFASIDACLQCETCRSGLPNQCPRAKLVGMEMDGLFTTIADVPATLAHDVSAIASDDDGLRAAACLEPAGCALLACESAPVRPGDRVLVFGGGPIGLFSAIAARQVFGASRVVLAEPLEARRRLAAPWCDAAVDPAQVEACIDDGIDVVIECSASLGVVSRIFRRIAPGGRVVLLGRSGEPLVLDAIDHMITNAISIRGSRGHLGGALPRAIALHREGRLPMSAPITGVLDSLDALVHVLRHPDELPHQHCKLLARMR
jgi:threonine dehydrogenase-like Zn-dependent dehydrogenase